MSLAARVYIGAVIALGALALAHGLRVWTPRGILLLLCYLALAAPASCLKVTLPGVAGTMSVMFLFLLAGIVELGLPNTLVMGTVCAIVQSLWHAKTRPSVVQVLFNIANIAIAVTAAHFAYYSRPPLDSNFETPFRLAAAAAVFFIANTVLIAAVIALTERKSAGAVWNEYYRWSFLHYLLGAAVVWIFHSVNHSLNWQAWILIAPAGYVVYRSYRIYVERLSAERRQAEEQRRHAEQLAAVHAQVVQALDAARTANAKLDAVIQASPLAILTLDRKANVTSWNSTAERLFGWTDKEACGRPMPCDDARTEQVLADVFTRTLAGEPLSHIEMTQWRKDGSPFEAAIWTAPLRDDSRGIPGVVIAVADVSDRKLLEEKLHHAAKMEAVGRLAGGVAHDFNNLLTVINGYSSMLLDSLRARHDPYASGQAEEILNAGTRAAELVSQLLAFSRRQMIAPKRLDINELVKNIEKMLRRLIGEHIELRTVPGEDAGYILVDPNQMEAALMNLATNARDAMGSGGVLTIETARFEAPADSPGPESTLPAGSYVRIAVTDTGHGMDAQTQLHIFEPFYTTKEQGRGTGLGLSSVYGTVVQNGGHIFVASEVGRGTTFAIYLPRVERPQPQNPGSDRPKNVMVGTGTILLVEDEAPVRRMLREALCNAGYHVWESGDGADALGQWGARIGTIDLVVTDVVMPVMSGIRLAEELRKVRQDIKIIFMSGHSDEMLDGQGALVPAAGRLLKPFTPSALVNKVREMLGPAAKRQRCGSQDD